MKTETATQRVTVNEFEGRSTGDWQCRSRSVSDNSLIVADSNHNEICVIRERLDRHYGAQDEEDKANVAGRMTATGNSPQPARRARKGAA